MSRKTELTDYSRLPISSSSNSEMESPPIKNNFFTINVAFNYNTGKTSENPDAPLASISNMIRDITEEQNRSHRRSSTYRRRSSMLSKRLSSHPDDLPTVLETPVANTERTQRNTDRYDPVLLSKFQKTRRSSTYANLNQFSENFVSKARDRKSMNRKSISRNVTPIPEEELAPKMFKNDQSRREYVAIRSLYSKEHDGSSETVEEKKKTRRRAEEAKNTIVNDY